MIGAANLALDRESTKVYEPVFLTCKIKVDPELILKLQRMGWRPRRGTPIGKMSDLDPFNALKRLVTEEAKTFIGYMKQQGFLPLEAETQMELWGPFREKLDMSKGSSWENFEEGNPLVPQGMWRSQARGLWEHDLKTGPRELDRKAVLEDRDWKRGVVFLIRGRFLATHGKEEEATGTLLVTGGYKNG